MSRRQGPLIFYFQKVIVEVSTLPRGDFETPNRGRLGITSHSHDLYSARDFGQLDMLCNNIKGFHLDNIKQSRNIRGKSVLFKLL